MLTKEKLLQLMADLESETVERTRAFDKAEKMGQAISAFANDQSDLVSIFMPFNVPHEPVRGTLNGTINGTINAGVLICGCKNSGGWFRRT